MAVASTNRISPPTGVQARPVATPTSSFRWATSEKNLLGPRNSAAFSGVKGYGFFPALRDGARDLPAARADLAFEVAQPRLAGVFLDDFFNGGLLEFDLVFLQPVLLDLPGYEVLDGDLHFFFENVAGQSQHFHPVEKRAGNGVEHVRRGDEHHPGKVERDLEVMVGE